MRFAYLLLLMLYIIGLPVHPAQAQAVVVDTMQQQAALGPFLLQASALQEPGALVLGEEPWRYHAGDDPSWADPGYDDATWDLLKPDFTPDSLAEGVWTGIGWFRLHLQVDPDLRNTTLALSLFHLGASEVYLDGEKIGGFGVIGTSAADEQPYNPKGLPQGLHLDDQAEHVLAVRYAYRSRDAYTTNRLGSETRHPEGFFILIKPINDGILHFYNRAIDVPFSTGISMGLLLILGGLHLLLYMFDRRERANLYFALFAFSFAVANYLSIAPTGSSALLRPDVGYGLWLGDLGVITTFVFLAAVYHHIFYDRLLRIFWLIVGLGLVSFLTNFEFEIASIVLLEGMRVTGIAIWKKKEGGWILGVGTLVQIAILVLLNTMGRAFLAPERPFLLEAPEMVNLWEWTGLGVTLVLISIPIAMSILLALRFSKTSRNLKAQLAKVEALSVQTLAQEREKQALITGQKERLEIEVAERTAELKEKNQTLEQTLHELKTTQAQLVQQEKMASLGELTAGIAHEIKNPLNFVNNFSEMVGELVDELDDEIKSTLDTSGAENTHHFKEILSDLKLNAEQITKHGKRADGIVSAMMQHASGGTGKRELTDVNALLEEYVNLAYHGKRAQIDGFNCEIERDFDEKVGSVEMIPQDMGRVFLNLLSNAFDAVSKQDQPTIRVQTKAHNDAIEIRVMDNGPGIPENLREKIFMPFFTTKPTGSGTGLGLSMSYDIVTQGHGGTLRVESEEDQGATFIVTLPVNHT